jgi:hypothetical protein
MLQSLLALLLNLPRASLVSLLTLLTHQLKKLGMCLRQDLMRHMHTLHLLKQQRQ